MTHNHPSPTELAKKARQVAILVDILDSSRAAYGVLETSQEGELRREMVVRLAELLRRTSPGEALALLEREGLGPGVEGTFWQATDVLLVKIHALLDLMKLAEARTLAGWLKAPSEGDAGGIALVKARLAFLVDRGEAFRHIEGALSPGVGPEVQAEALLLRAKWLLGIGDTDGAARDLDALGWLTAKHQAVGTAMMVVTLQRVVETLRGCLGDIGMGAGDIAARLEQRLLEGIPCDPLSLGALPAVVHALTVRFGRGPAGAWQNYALTLAQLFEISEQFQKSYAILLYTDALSERLFGAGSGDELRRHLAWLRERLGADRFGALEAHENRRIEALSRLSKRAPDNAPERDDP